MWLPVVACECGKSWIQYVPAPDEKTMSTMPSPFGSPATGLLVALSEPTLVPAAGSKTATERALRSGPPRSM